MAVAFNHPFICFVLYFLLPSIFICFFLIGHLVACAEMSKSPAKCHRYHNKLNVKLGFATSVFAR